MKPYFDTNHVAGVLMLIVTMGWGTMELAKASTTRQGATRIGGGGRRGVLLPTMAAATALLYLAPHIAPAAAFRPGAAFFTAGLVILVAGLVLRGWSIRTLGDYFTGRVMVSADQPVITAALPRAAPPQLHRVLASVCRGRTGVGELGLLAAMAILPLAFILWRIHAEETALMATLGDRYRGYAAHHKRLVPLIW